MQQITTESVQTGICDVLTFKKNYVVYLQLRSRLSTDRGSCKIR